jgi:hypothetical protein
MKERNVKMSRFNFKTTKKVVECEFNNYIYKVVSITKNDIIRHILYRRKLGSADIPPVTEVFCEESYLFECLLYASEIKFFESMEEVEEMILQVENEEVS